MESLVRSPAGFHVAEPTGEKTAQESDLNGIFPNDQRDLDELFPDPEIRQLLLDLRGDLQSVESFVVRIDKELKAERTAKEPKTPKTRRFVAG
jgi:hypothetical protein